MKQRSKGANKKGLIDYRIFAPSLLIIIAITIPFSMYEDKSLKLLNSIFDKIVEVLHGATYGTG